MKISKWICTRLGYFQTDQRPFKTRIPQALWEGWGSQNLTEILSKMGRCENLQLFAKVFKTMEGLKREFQEYVRPILNSYP